MPTWKRPYTFEMIAKMNAELQKYEALKVRPPRQRLKEGSGGGAHRSVGKFQDGEKFVPFAAQTPEVRKLALEKLDYLLIKHKDKLEEKGPSKYYGILCAAACAMAKRDLGLVIGYKEIYRKYIYRLRRRSALRTMLGLQEHKSHDMTHRIPKDAPKLQVTYNSLEGI